MTRETNLINCNELLLKRCIPLAVTLVSKGRSIAVPKIMNNDIFLFLHKKYFYGYSLEVLYISYQDLSISLHTIFDPITAHNSYKCTVKPFLSL